MTKIEIAGFQAFERSRRRTSGLVGEWITCG